MAYSLAKRRSTDVSRRSREIPVDMLLTVSEAAEVLYIHPNTVRVWANSGLLPCYRIGPRGDRRFSLQDLRSCMRYEPPQPIREIAEPRER
jgi:excisionase family DNA binding protein